MKLQIMLECEPPARSEYPEPQEASPEEQVKQAIDMIDSGHDSTVEWKLLNRLARQLRKKKDPRSKALMEMIDPVLMKYGMMGEHAGNDEE